MADHDIQKSRHLLKRLEEEMIFLSDLMSQVNGLSAQVVFVSSSLKETWTSIEKIHKNYNQHNEKS
jgi:hypothetical protein